MTKMIANLDQAVIKIEKAVETGLSLSTASHIQKAFGMAQCVQDLKQSFTDEIMKAVVMPMMNTKLGFRTDLPNYKNKNVYDIATVRNCAIEALLNGVNLTGNEFNIIANNTYITREGFSFKLKNEFPSLWFDLIPSIPAMKEGGAIVKMTINFKRSGKSQQEQIIREFAIKVNKMMGADAIIGKATRKALCALYNHISGSHLADGDVDDAISVDYQVVKEPAKSVFEKQAEPTATQPTSQKDQWLKVVNDAGIVTEMEIKAYCEATGTEFGYDKSPEFYINKTLDWKDAQGDK